MVRLVEGTRRTPALVEQGAPTRLDDLPEFAIGEGIVGQILVVPCAGL